MGGALEQPKFGTHVLGLCTICSKPWIEHAVVGWEIRVTPFSRETGICVELICP